MTAMQQCTKLAWKALKGSELLTIWPLYHLWTHWCNRMWLAPNQVCLGQLICDKCQNPNATSWIIHSAVHCFLSLPFCGAVVCLFLHLYIHSGQNDPRKQQTGGRQRPAAASMDLSSVWCCFCRHQTTTTHRIVFYPGGDWMGERFRTQPWHPLRRLP